MKGFPKHLNTKEDYEYIKSHFDESLWKPEFQKLLDSYKDWFFTKELNVETDGINDETHKVVEFRESEDTPPYYHQYELQVNPNAKIFKLGYTIEEVQQLIA